MVLLRHVDIVSLFYNRSDKSVVSARRRSDPDAGRRSVVCGECAY